MNIAFTIATEDYLIPAKTVGDSIVKYNPDFSFVICLIGNKKSIDSEFFFPHTIIDTNELEPQEFTAMRQRYNNFELSCALKPFFAEQLFQKKNGTNLLYFDSDILIFNKFSHIDTIFKSYSIVITPHCVEGRDRNDHHAMDLMLLNYGLYNAGFFGLRKSDVSSRFIKWWKNRMYTECVTDLANGKYVDQIWLNLVPVYFNEVFVLKDPGYNMAVWNMSERVLNPGASVFWVNGKVPLVFFHFSGYSIDSPHVLSRNHNLYTFSERSDVQPVFEQYRQLLTTNRDSWNKKFPPQINETTKINKGLRSRISYWLKGK